MYSLGNKLQCVFPWIVLATPTHGEHPPIHSTTLVQNCQPCCLPETGRPNVIATPGIHACMCMTTYAPYTAPLGGTHARMIVIRHHTDLFLHRHTRTTIANPNLNLDFARQIIHLHHFFSQPLLPTIAGRLLAYCKHAAPFSGSG